MKRITAVLILLAVALFETRAFDKSCYLDLMQTAVEAYTPERVEDYIARVDAYGITEHGFARLTSNLGILIAHGRLSERRDQFERMMGICVRELPVAKTRNAGKGEIGNDFAVKEVCCCIMELEAAGVFQKTKTDEWRATLTPMKAMDIYSVHPKPGENRGHNVAVYGAASECARISAGMGGDRLYADQLLADQLRFCDGNGMYQDPHQPITYDIVTRLQYMAALNLGYDGPAKGAIEEMLMKSALPTLEMQSVTGEIPYGGRSNQFLHNETFMAAVCEYYATWMKALGRDKDAARFKAAAERAVGSLEYWTSQPQVRHVKNRYSTDTKYGCESYAHFDKYMVTMGSWAYLAYRFADDSIKPSHKAPEASTFVMGPTFHRIVMNAGGYTCEFDLDAQKEYDSSGMGRFQKAGASPVIGLASPCASIAKPKYTVDIKNPGPLAIAPNWEKYSVVKTGPGVVELTDGTEVWSCSLSKRGLKMTLSGSDSLLLTLPAFEFDGETHSEISCDGESLVITFKGWRCRYWSKDGTITDSGLTYANRNGHLRRFDVTGSGSVTLYGRIVKSSR